MIAAGQPNVHWLITFFTFEVTQRQRSLVDQWPRFATHSRPLIGAPQGFHNCLGVLLPHYPQEGQAISLSISAQAWHANGGTGIAG